MAQIANLNEPFVLDSVDVTPQIPAGALVDMAVIDLPIVGLAPPYTITNRFPTPPTAVGFLTDVDAFEEEPIVIEGLGAPYLIGSALAPEGDFLEPTIGQIWPRIG